MTKSKEEWSAESVKPVKRLRKRTLTVKPCTCIQDVNEKLRVEYGAELAVVYSFFNRIPPSVRIETRMLKSERKKKLKVPLVVPTFCPFCGQRMTS